MRAVVAVAGFACAALTVSCALPASAGAELIGEFDARLKDVKRSYGAYTVVADARVYETSGAPPPPLTHATVHFPRGAGLRKAFLREEFYCDRVRLERYPPDPARCRRSHFASGTIVLDARPHIDTPFSSDIHLFLAKGTAGALASVVVLVIPNQFTPAYAYQLLEGRLVQEPASGKRFGYRLELPTRVKPLIPGLILHLAEMHLSIRGLRLERGGGRRRLFWTKVPSCPRSRKLSFGADYAFEGSELIRRRRRVDCRRFARRPSVHREGQLPGAPG
jgi:hypothetical protein